MTIRRRFTDISGPGVSMQAAKLMDGEAIQRGPTLEHAVGKWIYTGSYILSALKHIIAGKATEHFDIWETDYKEAGEDRGCSKILDQVRENSRQANFESNVLDKQHDDDVGMCEVKKTEEQKTKGRGR